MLVDPEAVESIAAGIAEADKIAKWDGSAWSALGSNGAGVGALNSTVYAIAIDGAEVRVAKVPSVPRSPEEGVFAALAAAAELGAPALVDVIAQPLQDARAPVSEWVA